MFEVNEEMVMYAFRYTLGRKTYSVLTVSDFLIDNWHRFKIHTKEQMLKEIEEAIDRGEAGMKCDIDNWKRILLLEEAVKSNKGEENV